MDYVCSIKNAEGKIIAFAAMIPSIARALKKSNGKLFPLGIFRLLHALKGKIPFFEVNTGAIARGYKTLPYPAMDFLKEFKALGFGAIITADCHNKDYLDCNFEEAREILSAAGFCSRWIFTKDGFKEVVL